MESTVQSADLFVWVKYVTGHAVKVSVPSTCDVSDLIVAIKGELPRKLGDIDADEIYLYKPEEERKEEGGGEGKDGGEEATYEPYLLECVRHSS